MKIIILSLLLFTNSFAQVSCLKKELDRAFLKLENLGPEISRLSSQAKYEMLEDYARLTPDERKLVDEIFYSRGDLHGPSNTGGMVKGDRNGPKGQYHHKIELFVHVFHQQSPALINILRHEFVGSARFFLSKHLRYVKHNAIKGV